MTEMRRLRSRTNLRAEAGAQPGPAARPGLHLLTASDAAPDWSALEAVIADLARTRAVFSTETSAENWISAYTPGRRMRVEGGDRSAWVQIEHLETCWATFERMGRITRRDVLEPGRCSALVMSLFSRVSGVHEADGDEQTLVLSET